MPKASKKDTKKERKPLKPKVNKSNRNPLGEINYKNVDLLKRYLSPRFKILPKKVSGLSSKNQRKLTNEVKKARIMGLLPFTDRHTLS